MEVLGLALASLSLIVSLPPEMPQELRRELLLGCSNALAPEKCIADDTRTAQAWVEVLDETHVNLEVELREPGARGNATRELSFGPQDDPLHRARAAGLSLGLMAKALEPRSLEAAPADSMRQEAPAAEKPSEDEDQAPGPSPDVLQAEKPVAASQARRKARPERPRNARRDANRPLSLGLEAGASFDPGLSSVEGGGQVRIESRPFRVLGLLLGTGLRAGPAADGRLSLRRITPTFGLLFSGRWKGVEIVGLLEAGLQGLRIELSGEDSVDSEWFATVRLGASLRIPAHARLQFTVTPRLAWSPATLPIYVADELLYSTAPLCPSLDVGVLWSPPLGRKAQRDSDD